MTNNINEKKKSKIIWIMVVSALSALAISLMIGLIVMSMDVKAKGGKLENVYKQSMYEVADSVNNIEVNLSKLIVSNNSTESAVLANDVYRQAQLAESSLSKLPLEHDTVADTSKFLNQIGDWCNSYANSLLHKKACDDYDCKCEELYTVARNVNESVKEIVASFDQGFNIARNVSRKGITAKPMNMDGAMKNNSVEYPELIYDGPFSDGLINRTFKELEGLEEYSLESIKEIAAKTFAKIELKDIEMTGRSQNPDTYELKANSKIGEMYLSYSVRGAKLINVNAFKAVGAVKISEKEATSEAVKSAAELGYGELSPVWYNSLGGIAYVNLAPVKDNIIHYTDLVKVKVALDDGTVLGLEATGYCLNHCERELKPTINAKTAKSMASAKLSVTDARLALIPKDGGEVLTYELTAEYKGLDYFVYINAHNGEQVNIMRVIDEDQGKMVI